MPELEAELTPELIRRTNRKVKRGIALFRLGIFQLLVNTHLSSLAQLPPDRPIATSELAIG